MELEWMQHRRKLSNLVVRQEESAFANKEGLRPAKESRSTLTIPKTTKLLLTRGIPNIELQRPSVCVELERMHLYTHSRDILFLEFTLTHECNKNYSNVLDLEPNSHLIKVSVVRTCGRVAAYEIHDR